MGLGRRGWGRGRREREQGASSQRAWARSGRRMGGERMGWELDDRREGERDNPATRDLETKKQRRKEGRRLEEKRKFEQVLKHEEETAESCP